MSRLAVTSRWCRGVLDTRITTSTVLVVRTHPCGNTNGGTTRRVGIFTWGTSTGTGRVVNIRPRGTTTTVFVRATATIGDSSGTRLVRKVTGSAGAQAATVGQDGIVDVGAGAVDFTCRHEDVVADFDELDTVDFDLFAVGDGSNGGFGGVSGKC